MQVLLVDDEIEFVTALAERLSFRGIEVAYASRAADAVAMAATQCYDVAILDMKMPGMGGLELKTLLAQKCPVMKFIFLTGHGSEDDFVAGSSASSFYLLKPVNIEVLVQKIKEAAGLQQVIT